MRRLEKTVETKQKVRIEFKLDEDLARLLLYLSDKLQKPVEDIVFTALRLYVGKHITDIV